MTYRKHHLKRRNPDMPVQASPMKFAVVGGLGTMASPMAKHWAGHEVAKVMAVHDRGTQTPQHDAARQAWRAHGAALVGDYDALLADASMDGAVVCCAKNGDDVAIISELAQRLSSGKIICHLSTVSARFVQLAQDYCAQQNVIYVNMNQIHIGI